MPKALSGVGRSDIADILSRVASLIAYRKEMTFRDLMRRFAHDASTDIMHQVLSSLEAQGYISYNKISGRIKYLEEGEDENSNS
jgi:ribosomal protein S19E (S16A)